MNIKEQFNEFSPWEKGQFIDDNLDELFELILEKEPKQDLSSFEGNEIIEVLHEKFNVSNEELLDAICDIDTVRDLLEYWKDEEPIDEEEYYS